MIQLLILPQDAKVIVNTYRNVFLIDFSCTQTLFYFVQWVLNPSWNLRRSRQQFLLSLPIQTHITIVRVSKDHLSVV